MKNPTTAQLEPLFHMARTVCRDKGYRVSDSEYASAINWAVWQAWKAPRINPSGGPSMTPSSLACLYALHECVQVQRLHAQWAKQDAAYAARGREAVTLRDAPIMPMADSELLTFVAHHGRHKAAALLGMGHLRLRRLLDDVHVRAVLSGFNVVTPTI